MRIVVTQVDVCPRCGGRREVPNPLWQQVSPHMKRPENISMVSHIPQTLKCPECDATGEIRTEIGLCEALDSLGLTIVEVKGEHV